MKKERKILNQTVRVVKIGLCLLFIPFLCNANEIKVNPIQGDLSRLKAMPDQWKVAEEARISLMAQPMANPRPKSTTTSEIFVKAIHDGKWMAIQLRWKDDEESFGGRTGEFSDAIAVQFPSLQSQAPPPIFMGGPGNRVHILHWKAHHKIDREKGGRDVKDLYPNMNIDLYPMDYPGEWKNKDKQQLLKVEKAHMYNPAIALGNPQAFVKNRGIDEVVAEGFGTSTSIEVTEVSAEAIWKNGEWSVILYRPLDRKNGSILTPGTESHVAFAVWQGSHQETGARKSVTMTWTKMKIEKMQITP